EANQAAMECAGSSSSTYQISAGKQTVSPLVRVSPHGRICRCPNETVCSLYFRDFQQHSLMNRTAITCFLGVALHLLQHSVRSQGAAESDSVKTSTSPDMVAMRIMEKPIYPIGIHSVAFSPDGRT